VYGQTNITLSVAVPICKAYRTHMEDKWYSVRGFQAFCTITFSYTRFIPQESLTLAVTLTQP